MEENGVNHLCTPPYHQSTNGQAERYVQIVKKGLRKQSPSSVGGQNRIDEILMFHRSTPSAATKETPSKLFLGREMQTRLGIMKPGKQICVDAKPGTSHKNKYRQAAMRALTINDVVQFRVYVNKKKWSRGRITARIGRKMYKIESAGKIYVRHIDQIIKLNQSINVDEDDWYDDVETEDNGESEIVPRYPQRIRRPVERYGINGAAI